MFSITDHNRFDSDLYEALIQALNNPDSPYPFIKGVLAGIEFDVKLDEGMEKCHIIAIFNAKNDSAKLKHIESVINNKLLLEKNAAYPKNEFEEVLKEIGLDTILIASQSKDIHNHNGKHNALSDSVADVEEIIKVGYINALEFQKPKVEGILINNLTNLSLPISLFSGSDCHDWNYYPYHDATNQNKEFHHSKAKILPTFKGLLMAVTSAETRFNRRDNINNIFFDGIKFGDKVVPIVNGVNAIIGENGSGKTTLLKLINGKTNDSYVKKLISENNLKVNSDIEAAKIKYIQQGDIIKKFNDQTLFKAEEGNNFNELDSSVFIKAYTDYAKNLKGVISDTINRERVTNGLSKLTITYDESLQDKCYYIDISCQKGFETINNPHAQPLKDINDLISKVEELSKQEYFQDYTEQFNLLRNELNTIRASIDSKNKVVAFETNVKNIMHGCIKDYSRTIKQNSNSKDQEIQEYNSKKQSFIDSITDAIKLSSKSLNWPTIPPVLHGVSTNPKSGFNFNREAKYNGVSMIESFYAKMFVNQYNNIEKQKDINTIDKFKEAIRNCTSIPDIEDIWNENFNKFILESIKTNDYITDGTNQQIGNTLGEMSLSYYKYFTQDSDNWNVLIVDQPEDNISNNNISTNLIGYFNHIRSEKQLIFVTHNPLLVVNLDVDNIIFVKNNKGILTTSQGCLEYEDEQTNVLEIIANNMDGGKETIEKRLKVYGKNN
ncbi:MAG: ATP-binding cassette domain-containing protein [Firmicutes bacterium]|nr:ATP-binding cassette domain-containing protein [Bacillota bacterium]